MWPAIKILQGLGKIAKATADRSQSSCKCSIVLFILLYSEYFSPVMNGSLVAASVPVPHGCRTMMIDGILTCLNNNVHPFRDFFSSSSQISSQNTWHGKNDNPRAMKSQLWVAKLANESVSNQQSLQIGFIWFYLDIFGYCFVFAASKLHIWSKFPNMIILSDKVPSNIPLKSHACCFHKSDCPVLKFFALANCQGTRLQWPGAISKEICWPCRTWLCWFGGPWRWTFFALFVHQADSIDSIDLWVALTCLNFAFRLQPVPNEDVSTFWFGQDNPGNLNKV